MSAKHWTTLIDQQMLYNYVKTFSPDFIGYSNKQIKVTLAWKFISSTAPG